MLRTDSEYMSSLRDGRSVYYRGGKKVEDITSHQVLSAAVRHASLVYRWQASPGDEGTDGCTGQRARR